MYPGQILFPNPKGTKEFGCLLATASGANWSGLNLFGPTFHIKVRWAIIVPD